MGPLLHLCPNEDGWEAFGHCCCMVPSKRQTWRNAGTEGEVVEGEGEGHLCSARVQYVKLANVVVKMP